MDLHPFSMRIMLSFQISVSSLCVLRLTHSHPGPIPIKSVPCVLVLGSSIHSTFFKLARSHPRQVSIQSMYCALTLGCCPFSLCIQASMFFILDFTKITVVEIFVTSNLCWLYILDYVPLKFKTHSKLIFDLLIPECEIFINEGAYNC